LIADEGTEKGEELERPLKGIIAVPAKDGIMAHSAM
jgi:hypothetical protein